MSKIYREVVMVEIDYTCDECKKGRMRRDESISIVWTSDPPKYPHKCDNCGEEKHL